MYIVHVDNSDFFRKVMRLFLSGLGHEYRGCSRGEDAIDAVMAGNVDWVITGLELADMSGEDFLKQLAVSVQEIPIIVVTGSNTEEQNRHLQDLGVKAVIQKSGNWKAEIRDQLTNTIE